MSIKSVCGMNLGEMHEFALALDKAGFNAGLVQEIVNSKNNELAKIMRSALNKSENGLNIFASRFGRGDVWLADILGIV